MLKFERCHSNLGEHLTLTRRDLIGTGLVAAGATVAAAQGTEARQQPRELFGSVSDGKVTLPPLHAPSESGGPPPNPDPGNKRLGVAVVGLGNLALGQILPGFGQAKHVRVT